MVNNLTETPPRDRSHSESVWPQAGQSHVDTVDRVAAPILRQAACDFSTVYEGSVKFENELVWGRLCLDTTVSVVTDLSGSFSKNRGAETDHRVIRLKPGYIFDFILPLTDRQGVKWASKSTVPIGSICEDTISELDGLVLYTTTILESSPESDTGVSNVGDVTYLRPEPVASYLTTGLQTSTFVAPLPALGSAPLEKFCVQVLEVDPVTLN